MTEDEAKTKWCPFVRLGDDGYPTAGMNGSFSMGSFCKGSECMAWRFDIEHYRPDGSDPLATRTPIRDAKTGYCGLAGQTLIKKSNV